MLFLSCTPEEKGGSTDCESGPCYHANVAPIIERRCIHCHYDDGIAPISFGTYKQVHENAETLLEEIQTRRMPPWHVKEDGSCNTFAHSPALSQDEVDTISAWVGRGSPEGDPGDTPSPHVPSPFEIEVSAEAVMVEAYTPSQGEDTDTRCFIVDPGVDQPRFLTAFNVIPGHPDFFHRGALYGLSSSDAVAAALQRDEDDEGPGYACFDGPGIPEPTQLIGLWEPLHTGTRLPNGTGLPVAAGLPMILLVQYDVTRGIHDDLTRVQLELADEVDAPARIIEAALVDFELVPGESRTEASGTVVLDGPAQQIFGVAGHMRRLGRDLKAQVVSDSCVLEIPRWQYNWQRFYWYDSASVALGPDTTLSLTCGYSTLSREEPVSGGPGAADEACGVWLYVTEGP